MSFRRLTLVCVFAVLPAIPATAYADPPMVVDPACCPPGETDPTDDPTSDIGTPSTVELPARLAGADRIATAVAISRASQIPGNVGTVIVARADAFPDALAAGPYAVATGGPILLTYPDSLPAETAGELNRLRPSRVVILGGTTAVSAAVEGAISEDHEVVERVQGATRIETAAAVAVLLPHVDVVYVATAGDYPDALVASAAAGQTSGAVLLTGSTELPAATADMIARIRPDRVVLFGGHNAASAGVEAALTALAPTTRIAGATRYDTAAAAASATLHPRGSAELYVATGEAFPDALSIAPLAARAFAPLLLTPTDDLPSVVADEITALHPGRVTIAGGPAAVSDDVARRIAELNPTRP